MSGIHSSRFGCLTSSRKCNPASSRSKPRVRHQLECEVISVYSIMASRSVKQMLASFWLSKAICTQIMTDAHSFICCLMSGRLICTTEADSTDLERLRCSETLCFLFVEDCHGLTSICPFYQFVVRYNGPVFCRSFHECLA
jgi:hypothetical protein